MISRLAELVQLESPSRDKAALDALAALLALSAARDGRGCRNRREQPREATT